METETPKSKVRGQAFTESEKLAIAEIYREKHDILFGKFSSKISNQVKTKAWEDVVAAVNKVSAGNRTLRQIQDKYKNMKKEAKRNEASNKREIGKTGGGPAEIIDHDPASQAILSTIPTSSISGIDGGIDMSADSGRGTQESMNSSAIAGPSFMLAEGSGTNRELSTIPTTILSSNTEDSDNDLATGNVRTQTAPSTTSTFNKTPQRSKKSATEILLERQVAIFAEQIKEMKGIRAELKRRNDLEEQKIKMKKAKRQSELYDEVSE